MSRLSEVTLYQSKLVKIACDITNPDDHHNMVIVPITVPEGPDWAKLRAEDFEITSGEITIQPYYNSTMMVNRSVEDGVVTGDFPIYMQFFTGNTFKEDDAESMNELIYSGVYTKGTATSGTRASIKGVIYKTVVSNGDKEKMEGKVDASLLENDQVNLQLGHVAVSIRKEDFRVAANSASEDDSTNQMMRSLQVKGKAKVSDDKSDPKRKLKKSVKCPQPPTPSDPDKPDTPAASSDYPEILDKNGALRVEYLCWVITKLNIEYTRKPTA